MRRAWCAIVVTGCGFSSAPSAPADAGVDAMESCATYLGGRPAMGVGWGGGEGSVPSQQEMVCPAIPPEGIWLGAGEPPPFIAVPVTIEGRAANAIYNRGDLDWVSNEAYYLYVMIDPATGLCVAGMGTPGSPGTFKTGAYQGTCWP